jgi:hypothetical protein
MFNLDRFNAKTDEINATLGQPKAGSIAAWAAEQRKAAKVSKRKPAAKPAR